MNNKLEPTRHFSAFAGQVVSLLELKKESLLLDLTLGDGGHTQEALEHGCRVVSVDVDKQAINRAVEFIGANFKPIIIDPEHLPASISDFKWMIININFTDITQIAKELNLPLFDAVMVDLGPSQYQVLSPNRGFSFLTDQPLDMRLDQSLGVTAADLLNALNEGELANLFQIADETWAKPIAKAIVYQRQKTPFVSTKQLSELVSKVKHQNSGKIHPATKVFMALRMAVNLERDVISQLLPQIPGLLKENGVVGIISFHSKEDKMIKNYFKEAEQKNLLSIINPKPLIPDKKELKISNRTRSAKLRLARKNH